MKHNNLFRRGLALLLSAALMLTVLAGCGDNSGSSASQESGSSVSSAVSQEEVSSDTAGESSASETSQLKPEPRTADAQGDDASAVEDAQAVEITLKVIHGDGSEKEFPISTTAATLGEALEAEGLISGEESSYGLFVTTVDGETVDDANQEWWCLTKGGEMWNYGVDATELADGDTFEFTFTVGY